MIQVVKLKDYSRYKPESCRNGGDYGFTTEYIYSDYNDMNKWEAYYSSTSDFRMCPFCGNFTESPCSCGEETEYITSKELAKRISMHRRYPDDFGGDKYSIIEWKEDNTWFVLAPDQNFKDAAKRLIDEVLKQ